MNREIMRLENSLNFNSTQSMEPIVFLHYPPVYGLEEITRIIDILIEKNVKKCYVLLKSAKEQYFKTQK